MHSTAAETLTIRGNNANAVFDFPDAPPSGVPDEEWAASQVKGQQTPRNPGRKTVSYRQRLVEAGWLPPGG